ncbi:MAG: MFS transporter, partial [Gammaproteobacteria bacterium]|nr:MFS transporter [Gammaproteobacteria bacterium]
SLLVMAAGFIGQPLFGWILDFHWDHLVIHGMPIYALHDFQNAMWIVSGGFVLCFIFTLFLKETRCCSR